MAGFCHVSQASRCRVSQLMSCQSTCRASLELAQLRAGEVAAERNSGAPELASAFADASEPTSLDVAPFCLSGLLCCRVLQARSRPRRPPGHFSTAQPCARRRQHQVLRPGAGSLLCGDHFCCSSDHNRLRILIETGLRGGSGYSGST